MKPVFFIAKKFHSSSTGDLHYSKPIIRIATAGVAVGIIVMLFSIAIANGFKREISDNVAAANAHFKILPLGFKENPDLFILASEEKIQSINKIPGVAYTFGSLYQPVLLESKGEIYGLVLKAGSKALPSNFSNRFVLEGEIPNPKSASQSLCLSKTICDRLKLSIGDRLNIYITNQGNRIKKRKLTLTGIFETGVPGIDQEIAFANMDFLLDLNASIPEIAISVIAEKEIRLDNNLQKRISIYQNGIKLKEQANPTLLFKQDESYSATLENTGIKDSISLSWRDSLSVIRHLNPKENLAQVIEIYAEDFDDLASLEDVLVEETNFSSQLSSIQEDFPEIFNWLNLLDTNVVVLLIIMAIVSLVNMASALLVLIIEKTNAIALLKTMGAANKLIREVFLSIAAFILIRGLLFGNLIAGLLLFLQYKYKIIGLDQEQYYVSFVPIKINALEWATVNIGTMLFCLIVLILPTLLIARIYPAQALRIE